MIQNRHLVFYTAIVAGSYAYYQYINANTEQAKLQAQTEQANIQAVVEIIKIDSSSNVSCSNLRKHYEGYQKVIHDMNMEPYLKLAEYKTHLPALETMAKKLRHECLMEVTLPASPCPVLTIDYETKVSLDQSEIIVLENEDKVPPPYQKLDPRQ